MSIENAYSDYKRLVNNMKFKIIIAVAIVIIGSIFLFMAMPHTYAINTDNLTYDDVIRLLNDYEQSHKNVHLE